MRQPGAPRIHEAYTFHFALSLFICPIPVERSNMNRRHFLVNATAALAAGCKIAPAPSRLAEADLAVPDAWSATKEGRAGVDTGWVNSLGDRQLVALVEEAVGRNPDLKIAAARVEQSRSLVKAARSSALPMLDLKGGGSRSKRNFVGFPFGAGATTGGGATEVVSSRTDAFDAGLELQWELDVWGRIHAGTVAAADASRAVELDYQAARASLAAQVARAWFALAESRQQTALAQEALVIYRDTESALEERFKSGQGGEQGGLGAQLRLARSDVAAAQAAVDQRRGAEGSAARALELLAGRYPAGAVKGRDALPSLRQAPPAGLPSALLLRRPDIMAAERRFAAQGSRKKEARRAVFPRLILTGNRGYSTDALTNLLNSDFGVWSMGGSVVQAVLTGGQVRAEIRKRDAEEQEALATLQKTVLAAFGEVEDALAVEPLLQQREASLEEAARLAAEADTEARANFRQGLGDLLTVLSTQSRAINARSQLAALRRLRLENRIALHLALGGDYKVR